MRPRALALALLAALLASAADADTTDAVPLTRLSLGDIGGWIEVAVQVEADGGGAATPPGRWLIDTGSTRHLVSEAFARRHGLIPRARAQARTALGTVQGSEVALPRLSVGAHTLADQTALLLPDLGTLLGPAGEGVDGVLGAPLLADVSLDLDLQRWTLRIGALPVAPADCPDGLLKLPLAAHQGLPVIGLRIGDGRARSLLLDTGNPAAVVLLVADATATAGLPLGPGLWLAQAPWVGVGAWQRAQVPVVHLAAPALHRALAPQVEGLAGTALLDGTRWLIRHGQRHACVSAQPPGLPGGFGLTLAQRDGALFIDQVLPGGPADAAGLRAGDAVHRWAGAAPGGPLRALWARVQGQEALELQAGPDARTLHLRRAHFLPVWP